MKRKKIEEEMIARVDAALERVLMRYRGVVISPATTIMVRRLVDKHLAPHENWIISKAKEIYDTIEKIQKEDATKIREGMFKDVPKCRSKKR